MQLTRLIHTTLVLLVCASGAVLGQSGDGGLTIYAGSAVFADPAYDSLALVEFPFSLTRSEFEFFRPNEADSFLYARIFAQVDLLNSAGVPQDSGSTYFSVRVADEAEASAPGIRLFNKLMLFVKPGIYTARLTVYDVVSKRTGSALLDEIVVEPPVRGQIAVGGPIMAYRATPVADTLAVNMRLVRNGFLVLPNPVGVFSTSDSMMYVYGEVYNLPADGKGEEFRLTFDLLDAQGVPIRTISSRKRSAEGASVAFGEPIDIRGWLSGGYRLQVVADDPSSGTSDTCGIRFAIVAPVAFAGEGDDDSSLTLEQQVALTWYLLTPAQRQTLDRLAPDGKRTFVQQYWQEHDPTPSTPVNENKAEMLRRYRYANDRFSVTETGDDGWRTERGRIYMTYGLWDQVDDRSMPVTGVPYQIWYYWHIEEGKFFVFVDDRNNNEYRLVHSNVDGEIYDKKWAEIIEQGFPDLNDDM